MSTRNARIVITGAFSYTGKYATRLLLERGYKVRTLTSHPQRKSDFAGQVEILPYDFANSQKLQEFLRGASCLINTYWIRFPHRHVTFDLAVKNTLALLQAAENAGVERIVHVSIANPSLDSPLAYYRGKAQLEQAIVRSGLAYSILRPTVIFGPEDILINNIAWFVRHLPVFGIPGDGRYRVRPIHVGDMASLIVNSVEQQQNEILDAVGPETFTFEELIHLIAAQFGQRIRIIHPPILLAYLSTRLAGFYLRDVVLTWQEYQGLMTNLLAPQGPSTGQTRLTEWLAQNREHLGAHYASELARHYH